MSFGVSPDPRPSGVLTGHEAGACRGTDRAAGVVIEKLHSLLGHLVDAWGLHDLLAVAPEIINAEIIGEDVDDVGFGSGRKETDKKKESQEFFHGRVWEQQRRFEGERKGFPGTR